MVSYGNLTSKLRRSLTLSLALVIALPAVANDRDDKVEIIYKSSLTAVVEFNSLKHFVSKIRSVDHGIETVRSEPDGYGFRVVEISKPLENGVLKTRFERTGANGDYKITTAQWLWRTRRLFASSVDLCDDKNPMHAISIIDVKPQVYKNGVSSKCEQNSYPIAQSVSEIVSDTRSKMNLCLTSNLGSLCPTAHWNILLNQSPAVEVITCGQRAYSENEANRKIELGDVTRFNGDKGKLNENIIHEMIHSQVKSETLAREIAKCCADPEVDSKGLCDSLQELPQFFKNQDFAEYGLAIDKITAKMTAVQRAHFFSELNQKLPAVLNQSKLDPSTRIIAINKMLSTLCTSNTDAAVCSTVSRELKNSLAKEVAQCDSPVTSKCLFFTTSIRSNTSAGGNSKGVDFVPGSTGPTDATNAQKAADTNIQTAQTQQEQTVTYRAIPGENRAAMNTFIATSASSSVALTRIATNTLAPLGNLIESTAAASEAAGGGSGDFSMAVTRSDSSGTTFVTSDGKSVVTKQNFASLPNAVVNAGLDLPQEAARGLAMASGAHTTQGGMAASGGAPSLGSGGGGSAGAGFGLAKSDALAPTGKLPKPSQVQSKRDAIKYLATVQDPANLLNQQWFDDKLVAFRAHLSYKQKSYGDPTVKSILSVEKLRQLEKQP